MGGRWEGLGVITTVTRSGRSTMAGVISRIMPSRAFSGVRSGCLAHVSRQKTNVVHLTFL